MERNTNITEEAPHCHTSTDSTETLSRRKAVLQLVKASVLCVLFIIAEAIGGIIANSLAIATDAAHLLSDLASFGIGLFALYLASRPPTKRMSFGWYRAEVLGAMISVLIIWLVTVVLVYLAVMRIINDDYEINALIMMITAALGAVFNICMIVALGGHGHSHTGHDHPSQETEESHSLTNVTIGETGERTRLVANKKNQSDINVRAAFIHVIGDLVQSIGVLLAAIIIYFKPEWKMADPICTFVFSILVLFTTGRILKDIFQVLMEGAPTNVSFNDVKAALCSLDGVKEVHNLRIWSLTTTKVAISVHLALESIEKSDEILRTAGQMLRSNFNIYENTIQTESYVNGMDDCTKCKDPKD